MALMLALQDFASADAADPSPPTAEGLPGYEAGFAAGIAAAKAEQDQIDQALVQAIEDIAFGFAEARQTVLMSLTPFFEKLSEHILPVTVDTTFRTRLIEQLQSAASEDVRQPCQLALHPDQVDAVQTLLTQLAFSDVTVISRNDLTPHGALVQRGSEETAIDVDAVLEGMRETLTGFFDMMQEHENHG